MKKPKSGWTEAETLKLKRMVRDMMADDGAVDMQVLRDEFNRADGSLYGKMAWLGITYKKKPEYKSSAPEPLVIIKQGIVLRHKDGTRVNYFGK